MPPLALKGCLSAGYALANPPDVRPKLHRATPAIDFVQPVILLVYNGFVDVVVPIPV